MTGYPIQAAKVQAPLLRDDTLARPRLLDWLQAKVNNRLLLVIAEAGYGKTTLLADFSRRTRQRTPWYRLDDTDRGWAPFMAHLVAAGREHEPSFAPATFELLRELGPTGPSRDAVLNSFVRELQTIAEAGAALIIDDFHLVEDSDETSSVTRELIARAPERFTIIIASRRRPALPLGRLRALGEVAELSADDLRFDVAETDQLFRDAYRHPLDTDTISELTRRTEGWVASLQLVQAAIRRRTPAEVRAFVRTLTGAEGDLYDYLAEEVVGHLPPEMQHFLMRTSLLESVEPSLAAVVANIDAGQARTLIDAAERFGLISRRGSNRGASRFHPLVRQFLEARLSRDVPAPEIRLLHRAVGLASEARDWHRAVFHMAKAGDPEAASAIITASLQSILASGEYETAEALVDRLDLTEQPPSFAVIRSRAEFRRGQVTSALNQARWALQQAPDFELATLNLLSLSYMTRDLVGAAALARHLSRESVQESVRTMAGLYEELLESSLGGSLATAVQALRATAIEQRRIGQRHYEGIALTNAAVMQRSMGDPQVAKDLASEALEALESSSAGPERTSARMVRAWALAHSGLLAEARLEAQRALDDAGEVNLVECQLELADIETWYGDPEMARHALEVSQAVPSTDADQAEQQKLTKAAYLLRIGDITAAADVTRSLRFGMPSTAAAMEARRLVCAAHIAVASGAPDASDAVDAAHAQAVGQEAWFWAKYAVALQGFAGDVQQLNRALRSTLGHDAAYASVMAELTAARVRELEQDVVARLEQEIEVRPERWRPVLRSELARGHPRSRLWAARLLDSMGEKLDIASLREFTRSLRGSGADRALGRRLARRLADRVLVHDQNRIWIEIGSREILGSEVRRKALALLCFLLTRTAFSATRDEVLEAMWPDMDPATALNSLNQTIYFLRRVIEPAFTEDTSPGYVMYQSDVVWLDRDLVFSTSAKCNRLIAEASRPPTPEQVDALSLEYKGRFALDFAYEEWSTDYREALHASYLSVIEDSVRRDVSSGHFARGATVARRALEIDPEAHQIERLLVRIYRLSGANAAAAEQYGHYAASLQDDLGVEALGLEDL